MNRFINRRLVAVLLIAVMCTLGVSSAYACGSSHSSHQNAVHSTTHSNKKNCSCTKKTCKTKKCAYCKSHSRCKMNTAHKTHH